MHSMGWITVYGSGDPLRSPCSHLFTFQLTQLDFYMSQNQDRRKHCSLLSLSSGQQRQGQAESAEYPSSACCRATALDGLLQHQRTLHSPAATPGATSPMQHVDQILAHQKNVRDSVQA